MDKALSPETGSDSEAGKAVIRQIAAATKQQFEQYIQNGGGLVTVHAANNSWPNWPAAKPLCFGYFPAQ